MAARARRLYQETRLSTDPLSPDQVLEFDVPSHSSHYAFATRASPKRRRIDRTSPIADEDDFTRACLASQSGIYFRPRDSSTSLSTEPHSILWRVLEKRTILELQAADLYYDSDVREEHNITLRLRFPSAIRPNGVAFAQNAAGKLVIFIIPKGGELFEFVLPKHAFSRPNALDSSVEAEPWFTSDVPNALTYLTPHTLRAESATRLWASLNDGGIVKLERKPADDGEFSWVESFFTEGGWKASMRGWVSWKGSHSARFDGVDYNAKTAIALQPAPDGRHVWTVCLDHTLRVWDVETGKIIWQIDLAANEDRDLSKPPEQILDPASSNLINIVSSQTPSEYTVITYSPLARCFKVWVVRDASSPDRGIEDAQPEFELIPPVEYLIKTSVWNMDTFTVRPFNDGRRKDWNLWALIRSGTRYHALNVAFNPRDHVKDLQEAWLSAWYESALSPNATESLESMSGGPEEFAQSIISGPDALVSHWAAYFFAPGRFSIATLEAALAIYQRGLNPDVDTRKMMAPLLERATLAERICEAVGSASTLSGITYMDYHGIVAREWLRFHSVVKDLHRRREYALTLTVDPSNEMPWLLMADHVAPLRRSAPVEMLWNNVEDFKGNSYGPSAASHEFHNVGDKHVVDMGALLYVCNALKELISPTTMQAYRTSLAADLQQTPADEAMTSDIKTRIAQVYDSAGFEIGDEEYDATISSMSAIGGFPELQSATFERIVSSLQQEIHGQHQHGHLSKSGHRALIRGAQEELKLGIDLLEMLLLLVTFLASEIAEEEMPRRLDVYGLYRDMCEVYRSYQLLDWLASTKSSEAEGRPQSRGLEAPRVLQSHQPSVTLMQWLWGNEFPGLKSIRAPGPQLLTYWCRAWALNLPRGRTYDELTSYVLGSLLMQGDAYLAREFVFRFGPQSPWGTYLQARVALTWSDFESAATIMKSLQKELGQCAAAQSPADLHLTSRLGTTFAIDRSDTTGLVDAVERINFGNGQTRFLYHVMGLFEDVKAMSQVAEFSKQALTALDDDASLSQGDLTALRNDLLSKLFTASLRTSRFSDAFATLRQQDDRALRHSQLKELLSALLSSHRVRMLLSLDYDDELAEQADDYLAQLALDAGVEERPLVDLSSETPKPLPHHVLYSWRISRNDMRGAALCLWEYLQKLQRKREANTRGIDVDDQIAETYLGLINCLSLVQPDMRWLLVRPLPAPPAAPKRHTTGRTARAAPEPTPTVPKRKVVTLADIRKEWQRELDRQADIEAGRFAYPMDDAMDVEHGESWARPRGLGGNGSAVTLMDTAA